MHRIRLKLLPTLWRNFNWILFHFMNNPNFKSNICHKQIDIAKILWKPLTPSFRNTFANKFVQLNQYIQNCVWFSFSSNSKWSFNRKFWKRKLKYKAVYTAPHLWKKKTIQTHIWFVWCSIYLHPIDKVSIFVCHTPKTPYPLQLTWSTYKYIVAAEIIIGSGAPE